MTLVLYSDGLRDRLQKHLQSGEEAYWLNIDYAPTPDGVLRFEDLLTNTDLITVDKKLTEFTQTWFKDMVEFRYLDMRIKQYFTTAVKVLAVLNKHRFDRVVLAPQDHTVRSIVKSYCAHVGARYTCIPSGDPKQYVIMAPGRTELSDGQRVLNDHISQEFIDNGKPNILWYHSKQSAMELEAISKSRVVQPIIFNGTNDVDSAVLGVMPIEMIPGKPSIESLEYPAGMFGKLMLDYEWVEGLKLLSVPMNEDFVWSLREAAMYGMGAYKDACDWFDRMVDKWNPKALVVTQNSFAFERAVVAQAKKRGIPSVVIAHGWYGDWYPDFPQLDSDYATAWGPRMVVNLGRLVTPSTKVVDVGVQRMSVFKQLSAAFDVPAMKKNLGIPEGKPVILYAANAFVEFYAHSSPYEMNEMDKRVLKDFEGRNDVVLLVRMHPGTKAFENSNIKEAGIEKFTKRFPNIIRDPGIQPWEAVGIADVVLGYESTLLIESLYCDKPIVELAVRGKASCFRFDGSTVKIPPDLMNLDVFNVYDACRLALGNSIEFQKAKENAKAFLAGAVSDETGTDIRKFIEGVCGVS